MKKEKRKTSHSLQIQVFISNFRNRGFTLLEVLLSLTLLTIILGAVYASFFTANRAVERFNLTTLKYHDSRTALDTMRREIEGAMIKTFHGFDRSNNKTRFVIEDRDILGRSASRLNLTTYAYTVSGINKISYFVQEKEGELFLLKAIEPLSLQFTSEDTNEEKKHVFEILDGIEGFAVETLFDKKWIKTWDTEKTGGLPEMVRVSIEFNDNGNTVTMTEYAKPTVGRQL
jgi:type II secretion system protein J